jgi:hypothetical protein
MSIEMIEAAWTDPMLRRELTEKGNCDIPDHPVGTLKGFSGESASTAMPAATDGLQCTYYYNSYIECNATYAVSGGHCCQ